MEKKRGERRCALAHEILPLFRARDISRSRFVSIFRNARCMRRRRVPSEGGKGRAINRRARNARNAAGHRATRDRDHSCQMPSNRFVSCHPVRLWWRARITFVIPRARHRGKCAIFPSLLFSPRSRFVLDYKGNVGRRQRLCRLRVVRIRRQMPLVAFENRERTRRRRACASSINPSFDRWSRTSYEVPVLSLTMENRPFTEHIWRVGQRYDCKCRDSPIATLLPFHASSSRNNDAGSSHASKSYAHV